jgi:hypothetical protein
LVCHALGRSRYFSSASRPALRLRIAARGVFYYRGRCADFRRICAKEERRDLSLHGQQLRLPHGGSVLAFLLLPHLAAAAGMGPNAGH